MLRRDLDRGWLVARTTRLLAALVLIAAGVAAGVLPYPSVLNSRADEVTASGDNLRDGWDSSETTGSLTPSTVHGGTFGELFAAKVDGQIYAQPIVIDKYHEVIVATENDMVYALDSATGAQIWSVSLGTPWPSSAENCTDLAPNVGVTGTPVYDPGTDTIYLVSQVVPPGHSNLNPAFYLDALNAATGAEQPSWPVQIQGAPTNDPTVPFNSFTELQRPALLLTDGSVYAAFGSHCDFSPYDGYVVGVNTSTRATTMWTDEAGLTDTQAGIWQSGGGLMSDGKDQIIFASGNGISPAPGLGSKPPSELAESVVRLGVQSDGSLVANDFFSPSNAPYLDSIDGDLGSGGPVGLPFGTTALPHLLLQAGKVDGLFVLNRDNLGGRDQGPGGTDAAVSETGKGLPGEWGHPSVFADTPVLSSPSVAATANDYVYYLGKSDVLRYYKAGLAADGVTPVLTDVAQSTDTFGYTSGSPVVTSDGTDPSTGVVWVVDSSNDSGTTGTLQAFPVVPPGSCSATTPCSVAPIWMSAPFSGAGKFTIPATDSGRVYIATRGVRSTGTNCGPVPSGDYCGEVLAFGSPSSAPIGGASPVNFSYVPVGTPSTSQSVTITNTSPSQVTINAVSTTSSGSINPFAAPGPYEVNGSPVAGLPQVLNPGYTFTVPQVTFTPGAPGGATGSLQFATDAVNFPVVGVGLSGIGTQNGFYASTPAVNFGAQVPVGTTTQQQITVTNGESVAETLTAVTLPGGPFSVSGIPSVGTQVQPGASIPLTLSYKPASVGNNDSGSLQLTGTDTSSVQTQTVISLSGNGVADTTPTLTATPTTVSFGSVPLGQHAQQVIDVKNTGNLPAVVTVTSPPSIPFGNPDPIASGLPVNPGYDVEIPVTFTPTSVGAVSDSYQLTWTDVAAPGVHTLTVPITGTGAAPSGGIAVPPPGGGWTFNGSARMTGTGLSLTQLAKNQAGSAVYSVPVPSSGLKATFTVKIGGGTGGDGLTLSLLDATKTNQRALGGIAGELGFGGLPGVAVTLDTAKNGTNYPSANFIGIATGASHGLLQFAATATKIPALRTGTHVVGVSVSGGKLTVTVDGKAYLSKAVTLPPSVLVGFTAATGAMTDNHVVSGVAITAGGSPLPAPGGGWSYNGTATTSGSDTRLTQAVANQAGSVVYPIPVQADGLHVTFNAQLGGGTGGDGLTFALLNPKAAKASTVGAAGPMLGLGTTAGVPGVGIALGTDGSASPVGAPADFVGTSINVRSGGLIYQRWAHGIGTLTTGTHTVTVTVVKDSTLGMVVTVWLDGVQVLQEAEWKVTPTVLLAFTAGTGTATDVQIVRNVAIAASG